MDNCRRNIALLEPSNIIYEGLSNILLKIQNHYYVYKVNDLEELNIHFTKEKIDIVIINPLIMINKVNDFVRLKKSFHQKNWIGLIYSYFDNEIISKFDDTIYINDPAEIIANKISRSIETCVPPDLNQDELSERETEVLIHLVKGLSNKEIAHKLNISTHTVISHRKNIIEKTGIRSLPGLTIYAISQNIISIDQSGI